MMNKDHEIVFDWLLESGYDRVSYVAPGRLPKKFYSINQIGVSYHCYDMDPIFKNRTDYTICDIIFDYVNLDGLMINFNAQKMYPIGKVHVGEFIIVGSNDRYPGDCNPVTSCQQLIDQNNLKTVYNSIEIPNYCIVWGSNER